jgi:D-alanyl-D-alanine carboxypeptidase/D-alanyl-D-alanine-endopeptidase (penicillin-binding protein 4)
LVAFLSLGIPGAAWAQTAGAKPAAARPAAAGVKDSVKALADWVRGRGGQASVQILDTDSGKVLAEDSPNLALNPASNMKVLTAAVALSRLGSQYRFSTGLYGQKEGARVDTLVLRGQGDPSLSVEDLWSLAQALRQLGVASVGTLLVDQSRFDSQFVPPAFEQQPDEWASFRAPVSAVALEQNKVTLNVLPALAGEPARVWFEPEGIVTTEGSIETAKPGGGESIQLTLEPRGPELVAHVGGHAAEGLPRLRFDRRLDDPRRAPGLALRELLKQSGITVPADVGLGGEAVQQRLVFHQSEPLSVLLQQLGKNSDNFYAEMLLKVLGGDLGGLPATSQAGAKAVKDWLAQVGALSPETRIENGSGLFDANRVSAATFARVLRAVAREPSVYPEFMTQLAIGGVDGTLRSRFKKYRDLRRVRAKTGTLSACVGLSGYVLDPRGKAPIVFSLLANGIEGQAGVVRQKMDRVVEAILDWTAAAQPREAASAAPAQNLAPAHGGGEPASGVAAPTSNAAPGEVLDENQNEPL